MHFATTFLALIAATFVTASPGGYSQPPKYTTSCSTKTWVETSTKVKPYTHFETKTIYVPVTYTKTVPTKVKTTCYETKTFTKEKKTSTVIVKPYTKVFYETSTKYFEVPYKVTKTETEVKYVPTKTTIPYVTKKAEKSTKTDVEYSTEYIKSTESKSYCSTKSLGGYY